MSAIFHAMFVCLTDIIFWFWKAHNDTKLVSYILKSKQLVHKWRTNCIVLSLRLLITRPKFTINVEKQLFGVNDSFLCSLYITWKGNTTTCCERDRAGHVHMKTWCNYKEFCLARIRSSVFSRERNCYGAYQGLYLLSCTDGSLSQKLWSFTAVSGLELSVDSI